MAKYFIGIIIVLVIICSLLGYKLYNNGTRIDKIIADNKRVIESQQSVIDGLGNITKELGGIASQVNGVSKGVGQVNAGIGDVKNRLGTAQVGAGESAELIKEQSGILEKVRKRN